MSVHLQAVGGEYRAPAALAVGERAPLLYDSQGRLIVVGAGGGGAVVVVGTDTPADAKPNPTDDVRVTSFGEVWNGATWDRWRSQTTTAAYQSFAASPGWAAVMANVCASDGSTIRTVLMNGTTGALSSLPYWQNAQSGVYNPAQTNGQNRALVVPCPQNPADTIGDPSLSATTDDNAVTAKASAGWLLSLAITNEGAAGYFQVFNKASDPVGADVPVLSIPIGGGTTAPIDVVRTREALAGGKRFATGIAYGWSSTKATYTAAAFSGAVSLFYV